MIATVVRNAHYPQEQKLVNELFDSKSALWAEAYQRKDLFGIIHQQRQVIALNYVDELLLPETARVLEIGCGAGFMAVGLAERGFRVDAIDSVLAMIKQTQRRARQRAMDDQIHASVGDAHHLAFQDQSFDLIIALGVTPWLHDLKKALVEMARVLKPNGHIVLNADNRYRLAYLLDPLRSPAFESIRKRVKREFERAGLHSPRQQPHMYPIEEFKRYLSNVNLMIIKNRCIGFGPFTLLGHNMFSDRMGVRIHRKLQQYADSGFPVLSSIGAQYIALARKK